MAVTMTEYIIKVGEEGYEKPTVIQELVRCKNCRYNSNPPERGNAACVLFYGMTDQMGFCHHGERLEQDETD